jgi:hypothetical protein
LNRFQEGLGTTTDVSASARRNFIVYFTDDDRGHSNLYIKILKGQSKWWLASIRKESALGRTG